MKKIIKKLFGLYDDYDLISFHKFMETNYKDGRDIGNGLLMWEQYINRWKKS
jgi:hypothetical protein